VHRIGRTGRAGRTGVAYIFLTPRQRGKLRLIEKATKQPIQVLELPSKEELNAARIERFKEQVGQAAKHPEVSLYRKIIADMVGEGEHTIEEVAAALAHMSRGGRPLLVDDLPPIQDDRSARRQRERGERRETGARTMKRPARGMERFWVGVGHADGMRPGNLVGAIANEVGIPGSEIGPIGIQQNYSTVDLPKGLPPDIIDVLQRTWVSGRQLRLRPFKQPAGEGQDSTNPRSGRGPKRGKFRGKASFSKVGDSRPAGASGSRRSKTKPVGGKPKSKKRFAR
jgi:ATP-dependent RNA helicase DeaD